MKREVNIILCAILAAELLAGCGAQPAGGDASAPEKTENVKKQVVNVCGSEYYDYKSLDELAKKAEYIVYGQVLSKEYGEEYSVPVTIYEISVLDSYKSTAERGDVLKLLTQGGETEDMIYVQSGLPRIEIDGEYVLFMYKSQSAENSGWLLNPTQAIYPTDGKTISKGERFGLTFGRLEKLRDG